MLKKILILYILFFSFCLITKAKEIDADFTKYYKINDKFEITYIPLTKNNEKSINKEDKKFYKTIQKNEKYVSKNQLEKADRYCENFIPNKVRLTNYYQGKLDYKKALEECLSLKNLDKVNFIPEYLLDQKLAILYARCGEYSTSNKILLPYINSKDKKQVSLANYQIGENYFYIQDYKTAVLYLKKVISSDFNYVQAQEFLYSSYLHIKDNKSAYTVAKNLINRVPNNPENYMKLAFVTTNKLEKLNNYYKAKQLYFAQNYLPAIVEVNKLIVPIEQAKIDEAFKKLSLYCKKPDWLKIKAKNSNLLVDDILYWDRRQDDFFEATNNCISKYYGKNLVACFNDINSNQQVLDKELAEESARRIEIKQREEQNQLLRQQNALIQEQNRIQYMRNYNYYPRYYDYYWGRYPWWF